MSGIKKKISIEDIQRKLLKLEMVLFAISVCMWLAIVLCTWGHINTTIVSVLNMIALIMVVLTSLAGIGSCLSYLIGIIRNVYLSITGKSSISKEYFCPLDDLIKHWGEPNTFYVKCVGGIRWFYSSSKMQEMIKSKRLDILYDRRAELNNRLSVEKEFGGTIQGIMGTAACSVFSMISQGISEYKGGLMSQIVMIFGVFVILTIIFAVGYREKIMRALDGSFVYELYVFELKLLDEKIVEIENTIDITEEEFHLERTRRILMDTIIKKRRFLKSNEEYDSDLKTLQDLEITYNGKMGIMTNKEVGVEFPGKTIEQREKVLVQNQNLRTFYDLLQKYEFK